MTDIPNYLTAGQERVINDFQLVMHDLMADGITLISASVGGASGNCYVHAGNQCFIGKFDYTKLNLASSINDAIRQLRTEMKSPAEQAQIEYDRAMKAAEEAKAKLSEFEA